jgi:hypothetical protein
MADENTPAETKKLSAKAEVALELVAVVKSEIVARIRVRDTLLAGYSAAAITTFGAVSTSANLGNQFLYVIPYLALAFTILVSYHQGGIGALGVVSQEVVHPGRRKMGVLKPSSFLQEFPDEHPQECLNDAQGSSPLGARD